MAPEVSVTALGANCERAQCALPMTAPIGKLDLVPNDIIQLFPMIKGAAR